MLRVFVCGTKLLMEVLPRNSSDRITLEFLRTSTNPRSPENETSKVPRFGFILKLPHHWEGQGDNPALLEFLEQLGSEDCGVRSIKRQTDFSGRLPLVLPHGRETVILNDDP